MMKKPNPFKGKDGLWYWLDEFSTPSIPYLTERAAKEGLNNYIAWLLGGNYENQTCEGDKYP
jgi:hypothetical protein